MVRHEGWHRRKTYILFREVYVRTTNIEFQLTDGIAHRNRHRSGSD